MKITAKMESREKCAESGWFAWDYLMDDAIDRNFILYLRPLGGFVYLDMLKQPFFKIESDYYLIKGIQGNTYFRIAIHGAHEEELLEIEEYLAQYSSADRMETKCNKKRPKMTKKASKNDEKSC